MKKSMLIIAVLIFLISLMCSCSKYRESYSPQEIGSQETVSYHEKTFDVQESATVNIENNSGDVEVYRWMDNKVKIEIDRTWPEEKKPSDFECSFKDNKVTFLAKDNNHESLTKINLNIYLPQNIGALTVNIRKGDLIFNDRVNTDLKAVIDNGNATVRSLNGNLNLSLKNGNVTVEGVTLSDKNNIMTERGNIAFRGSIKNNGNSIFETKSGNIGFCIYSPKTAPYVECNGDVENDSLLTKKKFSSTSNKIIINCGVGHIDLSETS